MRRILVIVIVAIISILVSLILKPVPIQSEEASQVVEGKVNSIYEGGTKDVFIQLEGNNNNYYLNRGLEQGLDLSQLKQDLIGKKIKIVHPIYWTPLDPFNQTRHVTKLEFEGNVIFSELE